VVGWYIAAMAVFLAVQRGVELYIANKNRQWSMSQGAIEIGSRHYPLFFLLHGGWFAGWVTEGVVYGEVSAYWYLWLGLFIAAQVLRYWCITSLGRQWNTRIIFIPGLQADGSRVLPSACAGADHGLADDFRHTVYWQTQPYRDPHRQDRCGPVL